MIVGVEGRTLQGPRYGVARFLKNVLSHMARLGADDLFYVYLSQDVADPGIGAPNVTFKVLRRAPSITWRHVRMPLEMRRDRVDVHFSPTYFVPLWRVCPEVVTVHDISFKAHPEWFSRDRRFLFDDLFWRAVKRAEWVLTPSEFSRGEIAHYLGIEPTKIKVVPNAPEEAFRPVDDPAALEGIRKKYGLKERFILTVGAIHTRRNLERLVRAVHLASSRTGEPLQLVVVGIPAPFSPPVDFVGEAERLGMAEDVIHLDYVPEEDLVLLYNACSLFAYPSLYEGFGLPVVEAMACGAPVACARSSALPEVGGDAVLYFDPLDVEDMGEAVIKGLGGMAEELREKGLERARMFSWKRTSEEIYAVLREAAGT
ncbi:MAG: glycosyltransferase family 1 protein [Candidatus Geothermincolales bacterium]